jgi:hypothetical protein
MKYWHFLSLLIDWLFFKLFKDAVSTAVQYQSYITMIVNVQYIRIWKEAIEVYLKVASLHMHGENEDNKKLQSW